MIKIKNEYDFKNTVICALRYALGRKTYITKSTADFIKDYPEIIDERVKYVMLNDLNDYFNYRNAPENYFISDDECDYNTWKDLKEWLEKIEVDNENNK